MLSETLTITLNSTSVRQAVSLPSASTRQRTLVFVGSQSKVISWSQLLGIGVRPIGVPRARYSEAYQTMLASENVLRKDWDTPEEDDAWADL